MYSAAKAELIREAEQKKVADAQRSIETAQKATEIIQGMKKELDQTKIDPAYPFLLTGEKVAALSKAFSDLTTVCNNSVNTAITAFNSVQQTDTAALIKAASTLMEAFTEIQTMLFEIKAVLPMTVANEQMKNEILLQIKSELSKVL